MKTCKLFIIAFLTGTASVVIAQRGPMPFHGIDSNRDGVISEQEFNQAHADRMAARAAQGRPMRNAANAPAFADMDLDGNGTISQKELMQFRQVRMQARRAIPGWGRGGNWGMPGRPGRLPPSFADMDANRDGCINPQELAQFRQAMMRGKPGIMPGNMGYNMPRYEAFDLNGDGEVLKDEFIEARRQRVAQRAKEGRMMRGLADMPSFEDIDTDGDDKLSREEFSNHQESHRSSRFQAR